MRSLPTILGNTLPQNIPVPTSLSNSTSWVGVAAGTDFSVAIDSSNKLYAWGVNNTYQLGDNTTIAKSSPVQIGTSTYSKPNNSFSQISAGYDHAAAVDTTGGLWTWGNYNSVNLLTNAVSWNQVSEGTSYILAIRSDGALFAWGLNSVGQLGLNDTITRSSPVQVGTSSWSIVSANVTAGYAVRVDGKLFAWGDNALGQLGQNDTINRSNPTQIAAPNSWIQISSKSNFVLGLTNNTNLYGWGYNTDGQLGDGSLVNKSAPVLINSAVSWNQISAGDRHSLAIDSTGKLYTWGNANDILINSTTYSWTVIATGPAGQSAAIRSDGLLFTWGLDTSGVLGLNDTFNRSSPTQVGNSSWTAIAFGQSNVAYGINSNGQLFGWGNAAGNALGDGTTVNKSSPVQLASGTSFAQVESGFVYTIALSNTGLLYGWGTNGSNQLGDGTTTFKSVPTQIGTSSWTSISAGYDHALAIGSDNKLYGWGNFSALGIAGTLYSWTQISSGGSHTVALRSDSTLWAWGLNSSGQLGDGTSVNKSSPVQVGTSSWSQVSAGTDSTYAIDINNKLYAWGNNNIGQLGVATFGNLNGDTINRSSPVQVGFNVYSWRQVSAGNSFAVARAASPGQFNNTVWGWGLNTVYQLGQGGTDSIARSSPVQVGYSIGLLVSSVSAGYDHTIAIDTTGLLYAWGNPSSVTAPIPTVIKSWTQVEVAKGTAGTHTLAIDNVGSLYAWGQNNVGQLGISNDLLTRSSPVQVGTTQPATINSVFFGTTASDYLLVPDYMPGFNFGSNNFTIECWIYPTSNNVGIINNWSTGGEYQFYIDTLGKLNFVYSNTPGTSSTNTLGIATSVTLSTWSHVAVVRTGNTLSFYINGVLGGGAGGAFDISAYPIIYYYLGNSKPTYIGNGPDQTLPFKGYISNVRIAKVAVYTGNFTVPTGPLSTIQSSSTNISALNGTETVLLTCQSFNINKDNSLVNSAIQTVGSPVVSSSVIPFSGQTYGANSYNQVNAGVSHTIVKKSDGTLWGWGNNTAGQLGDNTTVTKSSPVQISTVSWNNISTGFDHSLAVKGDGTLWTWGNNAATFVTTNNYSWTQIAAGASYTLAIRSDGLLYGWGQNSNGQLGLTVDTLSRSSPVQIGLGSWSSISTRYLTSVGIQSNGTLWAWGLNSSNQLLISDTFARSSPVQIGTTSWSSVSAGQDHIIAINTTGKLFGWGSNTFGQGGYAYSWTSISAGETHVAAIRNDNTLWVWGGNSSGQLGTSDTLNRSNPVQLAGSWNKVSSGSSHSSAIKSDGTLWSWGNGVNGRLGVGDTIARSSPVQISGGGSWTSVSANLGTIGSGMGVKTNGTGWAWGAGASGQLGINDSVNSTVTTPVQINTGLVTNWAQLSIGYPTAAGIDILGRLYSMGGAGLAGTLGDGTTISKSVPTQIASGTSFSQVTVGYQYTAAIDTLGRLWAWGYNVNGQLGFNDTIFRSQATLIPTVGTGSWSQISVGTSAGGITGWTMGLQNNGTVWTWGVSSASNNLGDGVTVNRSLPAQIAAGQSFKLVASGGSSGYAVNNYDSSLWAWGLNSSGQMGINTVATVTPAKVNNVPVAGTFSTPIQIGTSSWTSVSAGNSFTQAINNTNKLYTFGRNAVGQLGDGTTLDKFYPTLIGNSSWTSVSSGFDNALAIRSDGGLFAWGNNTASVLGDGTTINKSSPIQINAGTSWTKIGTNGGSTATQWAAGIQSNNTLWTWGYNQFGELGLGDTITRSAPVIVTTGSTNAISLNGTTQYLTGPSNTSLITTGQFTIEAWVNLTTGSNTPNIIENAHWDVGQNGGFQVQVNPSGTISLLVSNGTFNIYPSVLTSNTALNFGNYNHFAITRDAGNVIRIFINGVVDSATVSYSGSLSQSSDGNIGQFKIGVHIADGTLSNQFTGAISNLRIVQGVAVYTTSFVPQLTPLALTQLAGANINAITAGQTVILACQNASPTIESAGPYTLTNVATVTSAAASPFIVKGSNVSAGTFNLTFANTSTTLYGTGLNASGQIGDGTTTPKSTPVIVGRTLNTNTLTPYQIITGVETTSWSLLSAGTSFSVATDTSNKLWVWGLNSGAQLGTNDTLNRSNPTQLGNNSWISVSAGASHTAAVRSDGTLWTWGQSASISLMGGFATSWNQISVSQNSSHVLGIRSDGTLWAWGSNNNGQLGDNTTATRSSPIQVTGGGSWSSVSAGTSYTLGVKTDGTLWAWGLGLQGQLGLAGSVTAGTETVTRSSPVQIGTGSWTSVSAGVSHSLAIDTLGRVYAWGDNTNGKLGDNSTISKSSPVQVSGTNSYSQVSAANHSLALTNLGLLYTWGNNATGMLADGTTINKSVPVQIGASSWISISAGVSHVVGITADNRLFAWGLGTGGQLGLGGSVPVGQDTLARSSPIQVGTSSWSLVVAGLSSTYALTSTGKPYAWGLNSSGQLGDTTTLNRSSPVLVSIDPAFTFTRVSGGTQGALIRNDGKLYIWGLNSSSQLGLYVDTFSRSSPVLLGSIGPLLGATGAASTSSPVQVGFDTDFSKVYAGLSYTFALKTSGALYAWGLNTAGQLADGTAISKSSPVQVGLIGTSSWTNIGVGGSYVGMLNSTNAIYMTGLNSNTQLGLGAFNTSTTDTASRSNPTLLGGQLNITTVSPILAASGSWSAIAAGYSYSLAVKNDNSLWVWGNNSVGQLGTNDLVTRSSIVQIGTGTSWTNVQATRFNSLPTSFAKTSSSLWYVWGDNTNGKYGNNNTITQSSPVLVTGGITALTDYSNTVASIYVVGSPTVTASVPFTPASVNSVSVTTTDSFEFNHTALAGVNNDFTLELYIYITAFPANGLWYLNKSGIVSTNTAAYGIVASDASGGIQFSLGNSTTTTPVNFYTFSSPLSLNTWTHLAVVRRNNVIYTYFNGNVTVGTTMARTVDAGRSLIVFGQSGARGGFSAIINSLRYVPNLAVYDPAGFTVPTSPLSATQSASTGIAAITSGYTSLLAFQGDVFTNRSWSQITTGDSYVTALDANNLLYGWGNDTYGQLGDSSTTSKSNPIQVTNIRPQSQTSSISLIDSSSWVSASAGQSYSAAISGTSLYTWGLNNNGQLGTGDTLNRSSLTQITGSWKNVYTGNNGNIIYATNTSNSLYGWGLGSVHGFGFMQTVNRSAPTLLGTSVSDSSIYSWPLSPVGELQSSSLNPFGTGQSQSAVFNGLNNYIRIGYIPGFTGQFTIEFWFYPTTSIGERPLLTTYAGSTIGVGNAGLHLDTNNNLLFRYNGTTSITSSTKPTINSWNHVVACRDAFNNISLYLNGNLVGTAGYTGTMFSGSATAMYIGAQELATNPVIYFQGYITNIRVNELSGSIYTGSTITVPTSPLTYISGTSLLTLQNINLGNWSSVAVWTSNEVAINNGLLYTWGAVANGGLGINSITVDRSSIVQVNNLLATSTPSQINIGSSFIQASAGQSHSTAIDSNNRLYLWGLNSDGQLGDNTTTNKTSPVIIGNTSWSQVKAGSRTTLAVTYDNRLFAWGYNFNGKLGDNTTINKSSPVLVATSVSTSPSNMDSGFGTTTLYITTDKKLYATGLNSGSIINYSGVNQSTPVLVGQNNFNTNTTTPYQVGTISWTNVSAGNSTTAAISQGAGLYAWGLNAAGQLNTNDTITRSSPVLVSAPGEAYTQVEIGSSTLHSIRTTGVLYATGLNSIGQLGDGTLVTKSSSVQIGSNLPIVVTSPKQLGTKTYTSIDAGNSYAIAIDSAGILYAWGLNSSGQLGVGDYINRSVATQVAAALPIYFNRHSLGFDHVIMTRNDGTLYGWGNNNVGQIQQSVNTVIQSWSQVNSTDGGSHVVALRNDGSVWTWGLNSSGQLGIGDTLDRSSPVQVTSIGTSWTAITAGAASTYAVRQDGYLFAWGSNTTGQLGDNTSINKSLPVQIGRDSWSQISGGGTGANGYMLGIKTDYTLYAWGLNTVGQLGLNGSVPSGATLNRSSPVLVGASSWSQISAGVSHSLGITTDGVLYAWGGNTTGQLGIIVPFIVPNGDTITRSAPTQVSVDRSWTKVAAGSGHSLALDTIGAMFAWGENTSGQLGTPSLGIINRSSPVQIGTNLWGSINAGQGYSVALTNNGILFTWGLNSSGQLGIGTDTIARSSPVQIGLLSWNSVTAGGTLNAYGVRGDGLLYAWGGAASLGQLGLTSDVAGRSSPTLIGNNILVATTIPNPSLISNNVYGQVNAGQSNTQVLTLSGLLYAWGLNSTGQLGDGTTINKSNPVQVGTSSWSIIASNYASGIGIKTDGSLFAWGTGGGGQLGTISVNNLSSPVQVGGNYYTNAVNPIPAPLYSWSQISAGNSFSMAVRSDGKLFAWGADVGGQLGDKTTINKSQPTQIGTSNWSVISAGGSNSIAITS